MIKVRIEEENTVAYELSADSICDYEDYKSFFNAVLALCGCPGLEVMEIEK